MKKTALAALVVALSCSPASRAEPADDVVAGIADPALKLVLDEVLSKNPELIAARARALSADQLAPQQTGLPDPQLMVTGFPQSSDSQVGLEYTQEYTSSKRRKLRGEAASREAAGAWDDLEAARLRAVSEVREMWLEIAYLDEAARITREERETLVHFESLARARYSSGEGLQADAVKLQAEITRAELELVQMQSERQVAVVSINAMRGRPGQLDLAVPSLPPPPAFAPDAQRITAMAAAVRPELRAAEARLAAAKTRIQIARTERTPDLMLRGGWTFMRGGGGMDDDKDGLQNDEAMVGVGISLPIHRKRLDAMLEMAVQDQQMAAAERDGIALDIERDAVQLVSRIGLTLRQLELSEKVLAIQSDEALRSAESAYSTGVAGSLDLLDAERELFDIRKGAARARADLAAMSARLEGVLGAPLSAVASNDTHPASAPVAAELVKP